MHRYRNAPSMGREHMHRKRIAKVLVGILPAIALLANSGVASAQGTTSTGPRTITTSGAGSVNVVPDRLSLTLGVETTSARVSDALKANNASAQALIGVLKSKGIDGKDTKTSGVSISPQFDTTGRRVTAYRVSNSLTVIVRKIETSGDLIEAAAAISGDAIRIGGLNFAVSDPNPSLAVARDLAVKDASAQAEQLAKAAGVKLGKLRSIRVGGTSSPSPVFKGADARTTSTPISEGTQEITASVELVFDIQD